MEVNDDCISQIHGQQRMESCDKGWTHLVVTSRDGTTRFKPEVGWNDVEVDKALGNSKALNVIFNGVDKNMFRLINICSEAKEAWEILKSTHEDTSRVFMSRLHLFTSKLEKMMMNEDESISEFHIRLHDISNTSFALGEKMSEEKLIREILRLLPNIFDMK